MKLCDYEDGTAYIILLESDFKNPSRFKDYADFMNQDESDGLVVVPVDSFRMPRSRKVVQDG